LPCPARPILNKGFYLSEALIFILALPIMFVMYVYEIKQKLGYFRISC